MRNSTLAAGLLIGAAAFQFSGAASGESDGWVTLVDSTRMGEWTEVGKANWAMKDGALTADKITEGKDPSFLVSKTSYRDFQIRAEFWADDDANSTARRPSTCRIQSTPAVHSRCSTVPA